MTKKGISSRLYFTTFLCLIPLLLFGLYKNGVQLYKKDLVSFIEMIKPLIIIAMSIAGAFIGSFIREFKAKNKDIKKVINNNKIILLEAMIIAFLMPINSSPIILFIFMIIMGLFFRRFELNRIASFYILIEVINKILGLNSFENLYEYSALAKYNGLDLFLGFSSGGICSTSIILILISLFILMNNKIYKKEISVYSIISFVVLTSIFYMIKGDYASILPKVFGYNIFFIYVFVAPNLYSSSYTEKGKILSGILIGILTFVLSLVTYYGSAIIACFIVSILKGILDKPFELKN